MDKPCIAKIAVITGPTAAGKTKLGVILAKDFGGEVVSADSMQIYKGLDIGTAKAAEEEMEGVPHHMLSVADPREPYSVARYVEEADMCVRDILSRGALPILVGGTGLYIDSLISGRFFAGGHDEGLRSELNARYDALGGETLLEELSLADPGRAEKLHPSDKKRIVRALEIVRSTGKTITEHELETKKLPPRYDAAVIALSFTDRERLYERIDSRVDKMLALGLLDEVRGLLGGGISPDSTAMQAIGYKELVGFINGKCSLEEAVETIKRESRRYAKRQLTWLRRNKDAYWIFWNNKPDFAKARRSSAEFLHGRGLK